jgi:hypothetical protein
MKIELPEDRGTFGNFAAHLVPEWVEAALTATGTASIRHRKLPAEQVAWLVIGMALFRDLSIPEVVRELQLVLPDAAGKRRIADSSIHEGRDRIGPEPLRWLFERSAAEWTQADALNRLWRGRPVYGVDGSSVRVPDSFANREHFGKRSNHRSEAAYPLLRLVTVMALRSHLLVAARLGRYESESEHALARQLFPLIPNGSVAAVDRLFLHAELLIPLERREVDWVTRGRKNTSAERIKKLGSCDWTVELRVSHEARERDPSLPKVWPARQIRYQRKGFRPQFIYTSLLDPKKYPAAEIVALYHERWEMELGFDEVKTEMLEREECIRSHSPDGVYQEAWGLLIAYNLVRMEMIRIAQAASRPPIRISFVRSLHHVKTLFRSLANAAPGAIPKRLESWREHPEWFVLPPRRSERHYPRAVKMKMSHYDRNRSKPRNNVA